MLSAILSMIAISFYFFVLYKAFSKLVSYAKAKYIKARLVELSAFLDESRDNLQDYLENPPFNHSEVFTDLFENLLYQLRLTLINPHPLCVDSARRAIHTMLKSNESDYVRADLEDTLRTLNDIKDLTK